MSIPLGRQPLREETIAPAGHFAAELRAGQVLRVVDLEGQQVADLICFALADLEERLSIVNTISLNRHVYPRVGTVLWSERAAGDDDGHRRHLRGARSPGRRMQPVHQRAPLRREGHPQLPRQPGRRRKPWGIAPREVPFNLNVFMNCPIGPDGCWSIQVAAEQGGRLHRFAGGDGRPGGLLELSPDTQRLQRLPP